jgi:hypothetical protein
LNEKTTKIVYEEVDDRSNDSECSSERLNETKKGVKMTAAFLKSAPWWARVIDIPLVARILDAGEV